MKLKIFLKEFSYPTDLLSFVNDNNLAESVVSIIHHARGGCYMLFYKAKEEVIWVRTTY